MRFGRVPKNEKERIRKAMVLGLNSQPQPQQAFNNEDLIKTITKSHQQSCAAASDNVLDIIKRAEASNVVANIDPISVRYSY